MASKPATRTTTRASTRAVKTNAPIPLPTTTRATRARTAAQNAPAPSFIPSQTQTEPIINKKLNTRKPLANKDDSIDSKPPPVKSNSKPAPGRKLGRAAPDVGQESIMAYLRIRPHLGEENSVPSPYLTPLSDTTVNMTNPHDSQDSRTKYRFSVVPPSSLYTFSHVFPPNTTQSDFFTSTTLPLIQDVLQGQNSLLFTYGVTNSGKTYTVQGGKGQGAAGILPRSLDVIFNSIEGLHGNGRYRPVRLQGIELADEADLPAPTMPEPALAEVLGALDNLAEPDFDTDPTFINVDRNYEYTVWISYAEVYNEKVYDLLASVKDEPSLLSDTKLASGKSLLLTRQALPLRPAPPSDTMETTCSGKYIAGLRQFRVKSAADAKGLVKLGQLHRRVFGTLANRESSRSHGMVIIKIVRGHKGEKDDPTCLQISRLTLVDLAGSERTKHTHTTGDRLKEAGNINKSLMVLGQCLEVMRSNQRKIAMSLTQEMKAIDTRDIKKGLAIVPFRHSKLTETLMDYFVGDGRTVIIVNVNPYDTGYDENSHVMKFAALAREVYITPAPAAVQRVPVVGPGKTQGNKIRQLGPLTLKDPEIIPHPYSRKVHISLGGVEKGGNNTEAILVVREEDEPNDDEAKESDDDHPINPLVDALFDEVENLRLQLYEAEMRCAFIEAETREEVMREMEDRMRKMEEMYSRRIISEWEQNELKTDAKIDMLHRSGLFGSPQKESRTVEIDISEERNSEMSLADYNQCGQSEEDDYGTPLSPSPLRYKAAVHSLAKRKSSLARHIIIEERPFIPDPSPLPSDTEEAQESQSETDDDDDDASSAPLSCTTASNLGNDSTADDESYADSQEDDDEYEEPAYSKTPKAKVKVILSPDPNPSPTPKAGNKLVNSKVRLTTLQDSMEQLHLDSRNGDESVVILPKRSERQSGMLIDCDDEDDDELLIPTKKKKRKLVKRSVATEEEINRMAYAAEKKIAKTGSVKRVGK